MAKRTPIRSVLGLATVVACLASPAHAEPVGPAAHPGYRALRTGYVKTWYIYNDAKTDGILNPGDKLIATVQNWWTPVSAHTQHNYDEGPYGPNAFTYGASEDKSSGPMNFAGNTTPGAENYWLPRMPGTMQFYMTYSQYDNNDFSTFYAGRPAGDARTLLEGRNMNRNGWAMGWLTHSIEKDDEGKVVNNQTARGKVTMDIYVHDGAETLAVDGFGTSRSSPQVAASNDIDAMALDGTQYHPPTFDETTGSYKTDSTINAAYKSELSLTDAEFATIVSSMEIRQRDPDDMGGAVTAIYSDKTPDEIAANETEHDGVTAYLYEHAFTDRSIHAVSTSDGGVIAGLAGQSDYDRRLNNWADQQVIRIDLTAATLDTGSETDLAGDPLKGNITKVVFWDFGQAPGASQIDPLAVILDLSDTDLFPENRFYIAQGELVPEPTTVVLVGIGTVMLLSRRRKRTR